MKLYMCHEIRGADGELASEAKQRGNIQHACEIASVLRRVFSGVEWVVPHENDIVNELYFRGMVKGDDIVTIECDLIANKYDGIVVIGYIHTGTGVAREIRTAHDNDKFICFLDDVEEASRQHLANELARWEE